MKAISQNKNNPPDDKTSRTRKKKAAQNLQKLGEALAAMDEKQLAGLDMPAVLREALSALGPMKKHEARRRQLQYIGKLMRQIDTAPIQRFLEDTALQAHQENQRLQQIEQWRADIIAGDDRLLERLLETYPELKRRQVTQLVRDARKDAQQQKPPSAARKLFRLLKAGTGGRS